MPRFCFEELTVTSSYKKLITKLRFLFCCFLAFARLDDEERMGSSMVKDGRHILWREGITHLGDSYGVGAAHATCARNRRLLRSLYGVVWRHLQFLEIYSNSKDIL